MVERAKNELVEEFDGKVTSIEVTADQLNEGAEQYHLEITPNDAKILEGSKTGAFHEWLRITKNSGEDKVAEGSVLDMYLREVETVFPKAKKCETVSEALEMLKDKNIHFVRKVIGRSFKGQESKPKFIPQSVNK